MYGSSTTYLHRLVVKVLSQVVNISSAERCWSTYSFIHSVKRNNLIVDWAKSLVYVHYNLKLSHYCDVVENAHYKRDVTWDNILEETNLEVGAMVLECLEDELLGDHTPGEDMPHPSTSRFVDELVLHLSS
jgi:hypothetical protein